MTFSLAGRCARTGKFGAIVTSSSPAVAARCAWAEAGVGATCTQNVTDPSLGPKLLARLADGHPAEDALAAVVAEADHVDFRQLTVVDAAGRTAAFSGANTLGRHTTAEGDGCVAAGNLLASDQVPAAMVAAFASMSDADLGERLLAALAAGERAGGEEGPVRSCGMVIVDAVSWPVTDLRVDWSDSPVAELARIFEVWRPQADDYVARAVDPRAAPSYGVPGDE
ncbi:MAG: DUF1028 domain-containing protein [Streptosporangiales bacterium]|nr:DUF1028 domain-containing protein [Streptosporangiales bacterium]